MYIWIFTWDAAIRAVCCGIFHQFRKRHQHWVDQLIFSPRNIFIHAAVDCVVPNYWFTEVSAHLSIELKCTVVYIAECSCVRACVFLCLIIFGWNTNIRFKKNKWILLGEKEMIWNFFLFQIQTDYSVFHICWNDNFRCDVIDNKNASYSRSVSLRNIYGVRNRLLYVYLCKSRA